MELNSWYVSRHHSCAKVWSFASFLSTDKTVLNYQWQENLLFFYSTVLNWTSFVVNIYPGTKQHFKGLITHLAFLQEEDERYYVILSGLKMLLAFIRNLQFQSSVLRWLYFSDKDVLRSHNLSGFYTGHWFCRHMFTAGQ